MTAAGPPLGELVAWVALGCAAVPAVLALWNLWLYRPAPAAAAVSERVSVLIPARDEERSIGAAVSSALAAGDGLAGLEVVVLDDGSTDGTAAVVAALAAADPRVRLETAPPLPAGWNGKQHACWVLARLARHPLLVFLDADVRLAPAALVRAVRFLRASGAGLVSGFPRQETGTWLERLLIPLIHFVLLGFLPLAGLRRTTRPAFGAGCGQLMVCDRDAYRLAGGHAALPASLHDGVKLPRAFRAAGIRTDLFDATDLAVCRMYRDARGVWQGLAKNATEGLAAPGAIVPATLLLGAGQALPPLLLAAAAAGLLAPGALTPAALATAAAYLPRLVAAARFRQSPAGALLHPLGVLLLLAIQWHALGRRLLGRPAAWKGRAYGASRS